MSEWTVTLQNPDVGHYVVVDGSFTITDMSHEWGQGADPEPWLLVMRDDPEQRARGFATLTAARHAAEAAIRRGRY